MESVCDESSDTYVPEQDRIAVFDMDGTVYGELAPIYAEWLLFAHRALEDPNYKADDEMKEVARRVVQAEKDRSIPEDLNILEAKDQIRSFEGMTIDEFNDYVNEFLKTDVWGFSGMTYGDAFYAPIIEVIDYLDANDFTVYLVSGSDRYLCRALIDGILAIEPEHVIGMDPLLVASSQGDTPGYDFNISAGDEIVRTGELVVKNLKVNKVTGIIREIGHQPILSFGNSGGDVSMGLYVTTDNKYPSEAFMLVADDDERDWADASKAPGLIEKWEGYGFNVISMKNDFRTIYGDDVVRDEVMPEIIVPGEDEAGETETESTVEETESVAEEAKSTEEAAESVAEETETTEEEAESVAAEAESTEEEAESVAEEAETTEEEAESVAEEAETTEEEAESVAEEAESTEEEAESVAEEAETTEEEKSTEEVINAILEGIAEEIAVAAGIEEAAAEEIAEEVTSAVGTGKAAVEELAEEVAASVGTQEAAIDEIVKEIAAAIEEATAEEAAAEEAEAAAEAEEAEAEAEAAIDEIVKEITAAIEEATAEEAAAEETEEAAEDVAAAEETTEEAAAAEETEEDEAAAEEATAEEAAAEETKEAAEDVAASEETTEEAAAAEETDEKSAEAEKDEKQETAEDTVYVVSAGENLWGIAAKTLGSGSEFRKIADANGIEAPFEIRPGQEIIIPAA